MMKVPRVTVLMSVYNGERYLSESIESVLSQTYGDFEFIIINDGSTDSSQSIIDSYDDERIVRVTQENVGLTKSLNRGLRLAKGDYIARLDADDFALPERLACQVAFLDAHPEVAAVGSGVVIVNECGKPIRRARFPTTHRDITRLQMSNPIAHSAVMLRRSALLTVGGYSEVYPELFAKSQDYELYLRLSEHYQLANLPDVLCARRILPESMTLGSGISQLAHGSLAHALAVLRRQQQWNISSLSVSEQDRLWNTYLEWCMHSKFGSYLESRVLRQKARAEFSKRRYVIGCRLLWQATKRDPTWPLKYFGFSQSKSEHIRFVSQALTKIKSPF